MSSKKDYQTLLDEYKQRAQFVKKLGLSGGMMQFSAIMVVNSLKPLQIPYYKLIAPLVLLWAIYSFTKDFITFLRIEKGVAQIIVDGIALEKRNASFGSYFHEVLDDFNLLKILSIRSLVNLVSFGCFGFFLSRFIADFNPDLAVSHPVLALIAAILTTAACKLYYGALKPLVETKEQVFAAKP